MKERLIRQRELTARLNTYRDEYYNQNAPSVSDAVYDRLFDELTELEEETGVVMSNSPTQTVGYPVVSRLPQAKHDIPLLSLDKTKLISELLAFQDGRTVDFSLKLDGLTTEIIYEGGLLQRLSTRGDGDIGEDITHNAEAIEGIPVQIPYKERLVVAGESFIHCNDFERLRQKLVDSTGKPYRNSRNLAAGSVRAYNSAVCAKRCVHFLPFAVIEGLPEIEAETDSKRMKLAKLTEFGFGRVRSIQFATANNDMMDLHIKVLRDKAAEEDLPIDGLVMTYDSISYSRTCGRTGHHFKDGLAFKFEDELFETRLDHIEWTPTRSGEISPVAVFDTVEIDGCEVSRATLHNLSFIEGLELMPGNRILVSKRNMIIPQVEENLDRGDFSMEVLVPSLCPCCGYQTMIHTTQKRTDGEQKLTKTLFCHNPNCASQNLRKFVHFVGKKAMDIDGLSEATLEQFIARGWLQDFTDIYRLDNHRDEIIRMDGFGERSWQRLWDAIQKSRNTTFERYLIAMDILTLFAVAFELAGTEYRKDEIVDVQLAVGLPPAHYGAQYERFENYFLNRDIIDFQLDGRPYSVFISTAICFPQAYAAIMPIYQRIHSYSKVAVLDIGGFTADYLLVKNGEADLSACDSLDNGVITLYNGIKSKVNADFDILLDESDIDAILKDTPTDFDESVIRIVQEQAQQFINDLFGKLRERMIDLRSGKAVFVGGGSILLKKQIEASGKVGAPIFVDEISANTKGYELLFKAACMG